MCFIKTQKTDLVVIYLFDANGEFSEKTIKFFNDKGYTWEQFPSGKNCHCFIIKDKRSADEIMHEMTEIIEHVPKDDVFLILSVSRANLKGQYTQRIGEWIEYGPDYSKEIKEQ